MRNMSLFAVIATLLFLLSGCPSSFEDMQKQYNSNFTAAYSYVTNILPEEEKEEEERILTPDDEGFNPNLMLFDEYFVYLDSTLTLSAPKESTSFSWSFTDPNNNYKEVPVLLRDGVDSKGNIIYRKSIGYDKRTMTLYVPESGLECGRSYKLTLKITNSKSYVFQDSCGVVIYDHYEK